MADISHISIPSFNIDGDINDTIARTTINNHVADKNNPHNVTKAQIGLGNVDNTSDMDKPISTAVQNALDKKADNTLATESSPGLMSAEDKKAVDREFFKLVPRGATYVPHGADLRDNQYFKVGTYYHDRKPSEKQEERGIIYGMPTTGNMTEESTLAGKPFIMYVMAPFSDKYDDESTANEMTLDRLRVMIVYYAIDDDAPGESSGPIWIQSAFNRYGKDSGVVEGGQDWFTNNWNAITTDIDVHFIRQYINEHIYNNSNPHNVTKAQVGLEYVDNTADKDKSVNHANTAGYADTAQHAYNAGYADTANHVSWGNVSGKPSTYPPSSHTHTKDQVGLDNVDNTADKDKSVKYAESAGTANSVAWDNVIGKPMTMASSVAWDDITDKPSTYPPSSHTHTPADIGLGNVANLDQSKAIKSITRSGTTFTATALDGTTTTFTQQDADTTSVAWDDITDKPSTYSPSSHKHTPDEVGLGNVDNTADKDKSVKYAESAGSVAWENVTDKPSTYPPDAHTHTPSEVGLGNVDNTADIDKPISTAVQKALDGKANTSVATSSTDGLMSKSDKAKLDSIEAGSNVESVNGKTGAVTLNKADIGLGNVDNTADKDKSVKYAESAGSVDSVAWENVTDKPSTYPPSTHTHTPAEVGLSNVDNTADIDKSVKYATTAGTANSVAWDDITNKPSTIDSSVAWDDITDKPSTYPPSSHTHTQAEVGLGNVDNTADIDKPISTAVQKALDNKVTKNNAADTNGLLNSLASEETTPTDADYYISQHAGGGTTTTTYHRRPMSALWAFIKSKCDSIYATVSALNAHISNKSNPHGVTKAQVGLGNVDNTADNVKSVKYAASAGSAGSANSVAWGNVSGKPSTFTPSSHNHDSSYLKLSGGTMTGQLLTSFKNAVATGSLQASATTIPNLLEEVRYSSGCMGSVFLDTAYSGIPAAWYNFLYIPHRDGGVNGAAFGDNCNYGTLLLFGMTTTDQAWVVEFQTGHIAGAFSIRNTDTTYGAATQSSPGLMLAADKKAIDREFFKLVPRGGTYIPAKADLNSMQYLKVGTYYNSLSADAVTMTNCPVGTAFIMYVLAPLSEVYDNESTDRWVYRLRVFVGYSGNDIFVQFVCRSYSESGSFSYGAWVKMTNSNDLGAVSNTINAHTSNRSNPHGVTKAQVGLENVDNTADKDKSVKHADTAGSANSVAWGNVSGKPSTYPPSSHTHDILNSVYPVGSIYMSMKPTSPASFIGGTWLPIVNQFLFGSGGVYAAGEMGGEYSHTLTMAEVVQHGMWISDEASKYNSQIDLNFNAGSTYGLRTYNKSAVAHNNMPPYLVVYMWRRTA